MKSAFPPAGVERALFDKELGIGAVLVLMCRSWSVAARRTI